MANEPPASPSPEEQTDAIVEMLGKHGRWWWLVLRRAEAWTFLIPFPVQWLVDRVLKRRVGDSIWATIAYVAAFFIVFFGASGSPESVRDANEAAKVLFAGTFLVGTILSVSVAIPGQAIIKAMLKDAPDFAVDFVVPFMWAVMWGVAGGVLLVFAGEWPLWLFKLSVCIGVYGAVMELNAVVHTIRMYMIGLALHARDLQAPASTSSSPPEAVSSPPSAAAAAKKALPPPVR